MKKLLSLLVTAVLFLVLVGCVSQPVDTGAGYDISIVEKSGSISFEATGGASELAVKSGAIVTVNLKNITATVEIAHLHGSSQLKDSSGKDITGNMVSLKPGETKTVKLEAKDFANLQFHGHGDGVTKLSSEPKPFTFKEAK